MLQVVRTIDVNVRGEVKRVPGLEVDGKTIVVLGGFVRVASVFGEDWLETELGRPNTCLEELRKQRKSGMRVDVFTFSQKVPESARRYDFPMDRDSIAVARIGSFEDWWQILPQETRKNVRRAQKRGVTVQRASFDDALIRGIAEVQNETPVRQGRRYPHFGKSLDEVKRDHGAFLDRSDFVTARWEDEVVGFLKLVYRGEIASIMSLNTKLAHYDKRPANTLLAKAVELCAAKGISHLTYGKFNYGNKRDSSLTVFKIRHGFQELLVPRYYVPLSRLGALYTKLRLYRGLLGVLPSGVISAALWTRVALYEAQNFVSRCSSMAEQPNRNRRMERSSPPAGSNL